MQVCNASFSCGPVSLIGEHQVVSFPQNVTAYFWPQDSFISQNIVGVSAVDYVTKIHSTFLVKKIKK